MKMNVKNDFWFSLINMRSITCFLLLFASATLCHAQLFAPEAPEPGVYVHTTQAPASSAAALLTQANAQGALGFAFAGNNSFGSSPFVSVYIRNVDRPRTFTYEAAVSVTTATEFVTLLNTKGAQGFRYFGDSTFNSGPQTSIFASDGSGSTYSYKLLAPTASANTFVTQANAQGALGYAYSGDVGIGSAVAGFEFFSLFVKNNARNGTLSYETRIVADSSQALVAQANAQGVRGFRYRGNYILDGIATAIYMKDSSVADKYVVEGVARADSTSTFLTQANGEGSRGFRYVADYVFGPPLSPVYFSYFASARGIARDVSGDGRSDIVISDANGAVSVLLMNGAGATSAGALLSAGSGWSVATIADFDGDGKADLLIKNTDGRIGIVLLNGTSVLGFYSLTTAGAGYTPVLAADFNGDGKADIVLRNVNGSVALLLMNGPAVIGSSFVLGAGSPWSVTHSGDFNGDGKADLVIKNTDNSAAILLMDGTTVTGASVVLPAAAAGAAWSVLQVADVSGDGKADLVIRNASAATAILLMDGTTVTAASFLLGAGSLYTVTHAGDFNGDGNADLAIRSTDGSVALLLMNGTTVTSAAFLLSVGATATIAQVGDYNGDGKSDILLRNADGSATAVLMNGTTVTSAGVVWQAGTLLVVP
jgi:FG-GAP-like repeat